jgi:hypothetical protein
MGFGRRQGDLSGVPAELSTGVSAGPSTVTATTTPIADDYDDGEKVPLPIVVGCLAAVLFCVLLIDSALSDTVLISPINTTWLNTMRVVGLVVGGGIAWFLNATPFYGMGRRFKMGIWLIFVAGGWLAFNSVAFRIVELEEFGLSSAPFEQASYPITDVTRGRKGARDTLRIDPFHVKDAAHIPIPPEQYAQLRIGGFTGLCVQVQQRRSTSGAVEVRTDGTYNLAAPQPAVIAACGGAQ